jgi:hypothetical protein
MTLTLDQLFGSPDHYLHSFDGGEAVFVPMDRAAYARSIFLDRRISPAGNGALRVPQSALAQAPVAQPTGWIFHVAHCGSTLLARALDELSDDLVLREPFALRQLALLPDPGDLLGQTLALLSRRYPGAGPTLIKANVPVNFLLDRIVVSDPAAAAVFLHCSLRDYLLAILRSDTHRAWLRAVTSQLAPYLGDLSALADAELGAALWLAQHRRFAAALELMPNARSLDAEVFFAEPSRVLAATAGLLGREIDSAAIAALVAGPLFGSYSKNPAQAFDNATRLARRAAVAAEIAAELDVAESWLSAKAPDAAALNFKMNAAALIT